MTPQKVRVSAASFYRHKPAAPYAIEHPLTDLQHDIFALAAHYYDATGEPCSLSYLVRQLKKGRSTIRGHVTALVTKGWTSKTHPPFRKVLANL